jgi:hypothetical protein
LKAKFAEQHEQIITVLTRNAGDTLRMHCREHSPDNTSDCPWQYPQNYRGYWIGKDNEAKETLINLD